jgi:hypothetical protein
MISTVPRFGTCVAGLVAADGIVIGAASHESESASRNRGAGAKVVAVGGNVVVATCGIGDWWARGRFVDGTPVILDYSFLACATAIHERLKPRGTPNLAAELLARDVAERLKHAARIAEQLGHLRILRHRGCLAEYVVAGYEGGTARMFRIEVQLQPDTLALAVRYGPTELTDTPSVLLMGTTTALDHRRAESGSLAQQSELSADVAERMVLRLLERQAIATPNDVRFPVAVVTSRATGRSRLRFYDHADTVPVADHEVGGYYTARAGSG